MASIRKLKNGSWQATISAGRDAHGKQIREYITTDNERDCKIESYKREVEIEERGRSNKAGVRFLLWAEDWFKMTAPTIEESTAKTYRTYIDKHYAPFFEGFKLGQITDIHVKQFVAQQLRAGLSPTTIRKQFYILQKILFDALKHRSPMFGLKAPEKAEFEPVLVTDEMVSRLRQEVALQEELIILLMAWGGLRSGEIFALKWDDILWEQESIRVDESRGVTGKASYKDKTTKSKRGKRTVILPTELMDKLKAYQAEAIANDEHRLFPMRPDSWSKRFARIASKCGFPEVRFYDLRHYHATWLYNAGVSDQYAAMRLGHDVNVLKNFYQHLTAQKSSQEAEKIRNIR